MYTHRARPDRAPWIAGLLLLAAGTVQAEVPPISLPPAEPVAGERTLPAGTPPTEQAKLEAARAAVEAARTRGTLDAASPAPHEEEMVLTPEEEARIHQAKLERGANQAPATSADDPAAITEERPGSDLPGPVSREGRKPAPEAGADASKTGATAPVPVDSPTAALAAPAPVPAETVKEAAAR